MKDISILISLCLILQRKGEVIIMKKLLSLTLAMAMMLGLASCGSGTSTSSEGGSSGGSTDGETYNLIWAGTNSSSGYYALNVAVCDIINKYVDGVSVTLMETGGTVDDYKLMKDGEASFGQTSDVNQYTLQNDIGLYEGFEYTGARDLMFFVPQAYRFVVTRNSGITSLEELDGEKYNAGLSGSSSEMESMDILGALGIEPEWYPASTSEAIDAINNRQIVGLTKSGTTLSPDSTLTNLMATTDIEILSFSDEDIAKVQELYPHYGFDTVSCADYGLDYDVTTYCSSLGFCDSEDLPEDVVYNIVKAIDEHLDEIRAAYPGIVENPLELTNSASSMSLIHPGVVKYMEEKGMTVDPSRIG